MNNTNNPNSEATVIDGKKLSIEEYLDQDEKKNLLRFSNPVVDNFYVRLNFKPKDKKEVIEFIEAFRRKYTDRQHNIYVHDNETEPERLTPKDVDYDYLQKHLIAWTMIGCCEIFFSHEH